MPKVGRRTSGYQNLSPCNLLIHFQACPRTGQQSTCTDAPQGRQEASHSCPNRLGSLVKSHVSNTAFSYFCCSTLYVLLMRSCRPPDPLTRKDSHLVKGLRGLGSLIARGSFVGHTHGISQLVRGSEILHRQQPWLMSVTAHHQ